MDANVLERAEELAKEIACQATTLEDLNGVMRSLMKSALEQMLGAELNVHLQEEKASEAEGDVSPTVVPRGGPDTRSASGLRSNTRA